MSDPAVEAVATKVKPRSESTTRTLLRVGAVVTAIGILLAAAGDPNLGRWLTLTGIVLLVLGLHRFGRLGPDAPFELTAEKPSRSSE